MWVAKYKPRTLSNMVMDEILMNKIMSDIKNDSVSNMLFVGEIGSGKTSLVNCIRRDLYGKYYSELSIRFDSSIERKQQTLYSTLETLCQQSIAINDSTFDKKKTIKRMFIFDDLDNIPEKAQAVIVGIMEKFTDIRFLFTCTSLTDVSIPIQSRCNIFRIETPTSEQIINHLKKICIGEKYEYDDGALELICVISNNDLRQAINDIQFVCHGFGRLTKENIMKIYDMPNPLIIEQYIKFCKAHDAVNAMNIIYKLYKDGYNGNAILSNIFIFLKNAQVSDLNNDIKLIDIISKTRYKINKRSDSLIQLEKCVIKMCEYDKRI